MIKADRDQIVETARTYLNTPWMHAQSQKGIGVDCVGLFIGIMRDLGIADYRPPNYGRQTTETELRRQIELFCGLVPEGKKDGDLLLFEVEGSVQHCGMLVEEGRSVLHAVMGPDKVVEHRLDGKWRRRIRGVYRVKEDLWNSRQRS